MDHNVNKKRKLSQSKEYEGDFKRKNIANEKSTSCFGRCCSRKKHHITSITKIPLENENINHQLKPILPIQSASMKKVSNIPMRQLTQSPLYNESIFCAKTLESYEDPCIECKVQYGPDIWENIQHSRKQLYDNNKSKSTERPDTILEKEITDELSSSSANEESTNETVYPLKHNVKLCINNIIGDGVDQVSEMITLISTDRNKLPTNSENSFQQYESNKRQHQYPGLIFEKQNLKKTSQTSYHSSQSISNDYTDSNLTSNETNYDQQKALSKKNSSQNQEPYNWDYQEYQWSSPLDPSQNDHLVDKSMNGQPKQTMIDDKNGYVSDDDSTDLLYSIASALPPNKSQSHTNDLKNSSSSLSTPEFADITDRISNHQNKIEHNQQKIYPDKSISNVSEGNNALPPINSSPTENISHPNNQQLPVSNDKLSEVLHQQETQDQNDRFSATSVSDLFKQFIDAKKQKSHDLDSISTAYSIPVLQRLSILPDVVVDKLNKNHVQSSQRTSTEKHPPDSSNTEVKQLKSGTSMNTNLFTKGAQSHLTDQQENRPLSTEMNDTINQTRSIYNNIMNSWRYLLEHFLSFVLPSIHSTDNNINLSSSPITSNTYSWSTLIPTETLNITQSDNIGPWWSRRDAYDHTPATFIFANEPLNTSYSTETFTTNKQMCISIENRPCYYKYYSCPNTCHCCCSSSSF